MINLPVVKAEINNQVTDVVDARTLFTTLGDKYQFHAWFDKHIHKCNLEENRHYITYNERPPGKNSWRPKRDYYLTIEATLSILAISKSQYGVEIREQLVSMYAKRNSPMDMLELMAQSIKILQDNVKHLEKHDLHLEKHDKEIKEIQEVQQKQLPAPMEIPKGYKLFKTTEKILCAYIKAKEFVAKYKAHNIKWGIGDTHQIQKYCREQNISIIMPKSPSDFTLYPEDVLKKHFRIN